MKQKIMHWLFLVVSFLLIAQVSCNKKGEEFIKIGVIAPLTGDVATYGEWFKNAVEIAKKEINEKGGVLGKKIETIYEDSKADPTTAVSVAQKLINIDKVHVILGPAASGATLAVAPIAEKAKIVLLTPISSNYKITYSGDYIFRIAPSDALQGIIVAEWTYNKLGYKTAGILYVNNDYGDGLNREFAKNFEKLGGKVLIAESSAQNATDFRSQLAKIKNAKPDFVFVAVYPRETGHVAKQWKELGLEIPIIGTDAFHDKQVLEIARNAADGIRFTDVADIKSHEFDSFAHKYQAAYGKEANIVSAESYDGLKILALAIQNAGSLESDKIKDALYRIQDYKGPSGIISFDKNGDVSTKTFYKYEIVNREYKRIEN